MQSSESILACIVLTNYNGAEKGFLQRNLKSFYRNLRGSISEIAKVYVVDDGSKDKSKEILSDFSKKMGNGLVRILHTAELKAIKTFNYGILEARKEYPKCKYVITFDQDVCVGDNFFKTMIEHAEKSETCIGMFASNQYILEEYPKASIHRSTGHYYLKSGACKDRDYLEKLANKNKKILCSCFSGGLLKTKMLDEIGNLPNEEYVNYYNCPDLGFRAQFLGWKVDFVQKAIMWHAKPNPPVSKEFEIERNRIWNILRFFPKSVIIESLKQYVNEPRNSLSKEKRESYIEYAKKYCPEPSDASEETKMKIYEQYVEINEPESI